MERFVYPNRARAEVALEQMKQLIDLYGVASRADMKDIYGMIPAPIDQKFGWNDLSNATIGPGEIGDEIILTLPRAVRID